MAPEKQRSQSERDFFDDLAAKRTIGEADRENLERYANHHNPHLFAKERLFDWLGDMTHKKVLELGCGDGEASVQFAYCGAELTGLDISPKSIEVAKARAAATGVRASFFEANLETDDLGSSEYDIVICNQVLHHVVPMFDRVIEKVHRCLKPEGLFASREPVSYAPWLKALRRATPVESFHTPDEQPLRPEEFEILETYFPDLERRYYRILARVDQVTSRLPLIAMFAHVDNLLLKIPGTKSLAGDVVMRGTKR